jgi:hypothetical protein
VLLCRNCRDDGACGYFDTDPTDGPVVCFTQLRDGQPPLHGLKSSHITSYGNIDGLDLSGIGFAWLKHSQSN